MDAQYEVLRANGQSPSEAFNETVEELTQSLIRLVDENGMDWMYSNCSATAQRRALTGGRASKRGCCRSSTGCTTAWPRARRPVRVPISRRRRLSGVAGKELAEMGNSEMWRAGKATRTAPKDQPKAITAGTKGVGGRGEN